jgi:hypothetical protein
MKKIIKVFGLYNSGTSVLNFLLKYNFNHHVCQEFLGWKHVYINDLDYINKVSKATNDNVCVIVCARNPYDWLWRFLQKSYEFSVEGLKSPCFSKQNNPQEYYNNTVDMYNKRLQNYKNFIEHNNFMFINYEDLLLDQIKVLVNIKEKYNLKTSFNTVIPFYKKINSYEHIEADTKLTTYTSYKNNFTSEDIEFIDNNLDANLLKYFKY